MTCLENFIVFSTICIVLFSVCPTNAVEEIDVKRGSGYKTITPVPRRRSDPEFAKWENDVNPILYDDYEGPEYAANEYAARPYFGFPRMSRAGSRFYSKLSDGSQETIKRGGPGGGGMWFGPRLGRMQKRSLIKEQL